MYYSSRLAARGKEALRVSRRVVIQKLIFFYHSRLANLPCCGPFACREPTNFLEAIRICISQHLEKFLSFSLGLYAKYLTISSTKPLPNTIFLQKHTTKHTRQNKSKKLKRKIQTNENNQTNTNSTKPPHT